MRLTVPMSLALCAALAPASLHAAPPANAPVHFNADTARVYDLTADAVTVDRAAVALDAVDALRAAPVDRDAALRSFLGARGVDADTLKSLTPAGEHLSLTGVAHARYGQTVQGLPVYGSYAKAAFDTTGRLVHLIDNTVPIHRGALARPALIDEAHALRAALEHHYPGFREHLVVDRRDGLKTTFKPTHFFHQGPTVSRVAVPFTDGRIVEGFLVETWDRDNQLWHTVVGGHGAVLRQQLRTATDTYKIFPDHPGNSTQVVVSGPGSGNAQSPSGWVATNTTIGNNVDAYLDTDANNAADTGGRPVSSTQNFEYTANLSQAPSTSVNKNAAVASLFYWNNVIHDKLYRHGFTESAGNFQNNNFGKGGAGNDRVLAEAQDGSGTNNANFATPADGSKPRMQMYVWTLTTPNRDGDLDSDIIWHEYGHGLTWRMIGDMSGPLAGALGEGMSDVLSIYANNDDVVGEYSANDITGIRRAAYDGYPYTYGDHGGSSVHADGEIYAATMWRLKELWQGSGRSMDELYDVVIDGMNYTPSRPANEDMRDGLLATPKSDAAEECLIWDAFAEFGVGVGAQGTESCFWIFCFGSSTTESFSVPSQCQ